MMEETEETQETEGILCPGCLEPVPESEHFCPKCGTPLDVFAELDPMNAIRAQGSAFRRGAQQPSLLVLIGMWLLFFPFLIAGIVILVSALLGKTVVLPLLAFTFIIYGAILFRVTRNYLRTRKKTESIDINNLE